MSVGTLGTIASFVVFGLIGWAIGRKGARRAGPWRLILLLVVAGAGSHFWGPRARFLDVLGFRMLMDDCFVACCLGGVVGLLTRNRRLRGLRGAEAAAAAR